jgi:hypothetical protein
MASSATEARVFPRRPRLLLCAVAAALAVSCAAPRPKGPVLLHPVPPNVDGYALVQGALVFSGPGFTVSARPWDYRLVAKELRDAGAASPFGDTDEAAGKFLFVRVRFENRSAGTLVFNPMRASLLSEGQSPLLPLDNADLFAFAGEDLANAEARSRTFQRISFDGTATVRGGASLERYLVFAAPEEAPKQLALELDDLWLDAKSFAPTFVFETFPGK